MDGVPNKWRGVPGNVLWWLIDNQDELWKIDKSDWDKFMEDGTLPEPFDFLNPDTSGYRDKFAGSSPIEYTEGDPNAEPVVSVNGYTLLQACEGSPGASPDLVGLGANFTFRAGVCDMQIPQNNGNYPSPGAVFTTWGFWPDPLGMGQDYFTNWRFHSFWSRVPGVTPDGTWSSGPATTSRTLPGGAIQGEWSVGWLGNVNQSNPTGQPRKSAKQKAAEKVALQLAGTRYWSGYNPDDKPAWHHHPAVSITVPLPAPTAVPPRWTPPATVITKPSEPYKPIGSAKDRKGMIKGRALFQAAQRGFHALTEYNDFIESFYDALPKKYQTCKIGGPACKTLQVSRHLGEVDIPTAVVNWLWNDFEDRVLGRGFGALDKAAKKLGTRDWKLLNSANDSPLDEGLGELYGEFVKDHVNPTKKEFVDWAKENLLQ